MWDWMLVYFLRWSVYASCLFMGIAAVPSGGTFWLSNHRCFLVGLPQFFHHFGGPASDPIEENFSFCSWEVFMLSHACDLHSASVISRPLTLNLLTHQFASVLTPNPRVSVHHPGLDDEFSLTCSWGVTYLSGYANGKTWPQFCSLSTIEGSMHESHISRWLGSKCTQTAFSYLFSTSQVWFDRMTPSGQSSSSQMAAADSSLGPSKGSSEEQPLSRRHTLPPCRVCGAQAKGFHYGANTCEACKVRSSTTFYSSLLCHYFFCHRRVSSDAVSYAKWHTSAWMTPYDVRSSRACARTALPVATSAAYRLGCLLKVCPPFILSSLTLFTDLCFLCSHPNWTLHNGKEEPRHPGAEGVRGSAAAGRTQCLKGDKGGDE